MPKPELSWASSPATRKSMQGNRSRDTNPELAVRRALFADGFRFRVDYKIPNQNRRRCDMAFPGAKLAVFIDGCFWHRCEDHYVAPKSNREYWDEKTKNNIRRDRESESLLEDAGWKVLRFWEHEDPDAVARKIKRAVRQRRRRG